MTLPVLTLTVEGLFALLLAVTIVFAVKLNARISGLRQHETEMRETIERLNEASNQASESTHLLKAAGVEAERRLAATIDLAQALRDDLTFMIEHGERIADRISQAPERLRPATTSRPAARPATAGPSGVGAESGTVPSGDAGAADRPYRSEVEEALARVIRSTGSTG